MSIRSIFILLLLSSVEARTSFSAEDPRAARAIAARVGAASLPEELRPFFEGRSEAIAGRDALGSATKDRADGAGEWLDSEARTADADDRRAAARERLQSLTAKKVDRRGDGPAPSTLPERVSRQFIDLRDAFRGRVEDEIILASAEMLRRCVDAALPFNAADPRWFDAASKRKEGEAPRSARRLFHVALIERLADRLAAECRVAPGRVVPIDSVEEEVLAVSGEAHEAGLALERIEREWRATIEADRGERTNAARMNVGEAMLADRCAAILETQIEAGALLWARVVATAWTQAGRPALPGGGPSGAANAASDGKKPASTESALFVGSRSSKVFHRASCRHVDRIKPENRVRFGSAREARDQGREPCKSCKPDQP